MPCSICFKNYKQPTRIIACPACNYETCKSCLRQYFENVPEPKCANCSLPWNREFIVEHFKTFKASYNQMQEKLIFEREMALMPQTQFYVEREIEAVKLEKNVAVMEMEYEKLLEGIRTLKQKIFETNNIIEQLRMIPEREGTHRIEQPKIFCKCPAEACRGFVSSENFTCGVCSLKMCKKCANPLKEFEEGLSASEVEGQNASEVAIEGESEGEVHGLSENEGQEKDRSKEKIQRKRHVCNPDDVLTAKSIKKDTKPCPKCASLIYKISGCDQMWCTQCNTAFSWQTGEIEKGRVHNPHFYEWQRAKNNGVAPRVPGDIFPADLDCDNYVSYDRLVSSLNSTFVSNNENALRVFLILQQLHRFVGHINDEIETPQPICNISLRINYLMQKINDDEFKREIKRRHFSREFKLEVRQIIDLFCQESDNLFREIILNPMSSDENFFISIEEKLDRLILFVNQQLAVIAKKWGKTRRILDKALVNYEFPHIKNELKNLGLRMFSTYFSSRFCKFSFSMFKKPTENHE